MQEDFHYYATYCAAYIAGFSHEESLAICYSAQFVDTCSETLLEKIRAPRDAATTQLQLELMDARTDLLARHAITRIWSSFHFLPRDLFAPVKGGKGNIEFLVSLAKTEGEEAPSPVPAPELEAMAEAAVREAHAALDERQA